MAGKDLGAIDRHTKNLIYRTVKQIGANAKEEQKRANLLNFNIEWTEFQRFTPLQVIGLMLLREDVNNKIKKVLFHPFGNFIWQEKLSKRKINKDVILIDFLIEINLY